MSIKIQRKVWTLPELRDYWRVSELDLYRAILDGALKPCVMLDFPLRPVAVIDGVATVLQGVQPEPVNKYLYPCFTKQIEPFNYRCEIVCDMAIPAEGCQLWQLPRPTTLAEMMNYAVCVLEDVQEAEAVLSGVNDETELSTKETNTISKMVLVMYEKGYGFSALDGEDDVKGATEIVGDSKDMGIPISYNTVKRHLLECRQRAKPKERKQRSTAPLALSIN